MLKTILFIFRDKTGKALKLLLEKGFNPNVQHNDNKSTPLHLAVKNNNEMAVRILTQNRDCDVNLQVKCLQTFLGLHPRDKAAMFVVHTILFFAEFA